jgi:hypothetical protein
MDQTSGSQWRDRSGLAPDSSAVAASHHVTSDWIASASGLARPTHSLSRCRNYVAFVSGGSEGRGSKSAYSGVAGGIQSEA